MTHALTCAQLIQYSAVYRFGSLSNSASGRNPKFIIIIDTVSKFLSIFNTLTTKLLLLNCSDLHYAMFSAVMHYSEFVHPLQVLWLLVYLLSALVIDITDSPSGKCVETRRLIEVLR